MSHATPHPTILVVEDEALVRDCMVSHLEDAGFNVLAASNADRALLTFEAEPELTTVVTDINMPGKMDGLALAHMIVKMRPEVQMIITSALEPGKGAMPAGVQFVPKPYDCYRLVSLIKAA